VLFFSYATVREDGGMVNDGMMIDHQKERERPTERRVAMAFLEKRRGKYDVAEAILFGSRARDDHGPDSDLDLAIVLNGRRGDFIEVKLDMAGIAFDVMMETGVLLHAFPAWDDDLSHPERFTDPGLIQNIVADGGQAGMIAECRGKSLATMELPSVLQFVRV
jgi:predicted nucleotidyltransferase